MRQLHFVQFVVGLQGGEGGEGSRACATATRLHALSAAAPIRVFEVRVVGVTNITTGKCLDRHSLAGAQLGLAAGSWTTSRGCP